MSEYAASPDTVSGRPWPFRLARDSRIRWLLGVAALAGAYYGLAKVGYALEFAGPVAAIVWLPVGIGIAFLYLGGLRFWPGVLAGDLLANDYSALPLGSALGQTSGNILEVLVATVLIRRLVPRGSPLGSVVGLAGMLAAIAVGTAVSATIGSLSLWLGDVIESSAIPTVWRTWWLGDAAGALVVLPLALAWYRPPRRSWWSDRALEGAVLLIALVGLSELALRSHQPLSYLIFPALIWAALRFGQPGATLAITVTVVLTVWNTTHYVGPFVFHSITRSVLIAQLFIAVAALSTLCLAAVVSEREEFAERLRSSRARLVRAADTERRRLEHNLHDGAQNRLTALAVHLHDVAEQAREAPERAAALFEYAERELQLSIDELRELGRGIHPAVLTDLGLRNAIQSLALRSTVPIELLELPSTRLDETAEAAAYYVLAEAITNAQRHAHASSIQVRAAVTPSFIDIEIVDDGVGGAAESGGSGLQGLRDRVEASGGKFRVESVPGRGTRVAAVIPAVGIAPRASH
jgi:signal transduction histidine kinase